VQAARKASVKRELDINVEDKSHVVYDTKYTGSRKARTRTTTTTAAAAATTTEVMRYV
jgi:hypothetical protein